MTRHLLPRFAHVVAVEPDDAMCAKLEELSPEVESLRGRAEELPLADDSADAVFVGEAFHWFEGTRALPEIARVLRPHGGLALLWNVITPGLEPALPKHVDDAVDALLEEAFRRTRRPGGARIASGAWREPFAESEFEELRCDQIPGRVEVGRDELTAYYLSISSIASLPADDRRELGIKLRDLLPDVRYRRSLRTDICWTRRR